MSDLFGVNHSYLLLTTGYSTNAKKPSKDKKLERLNLQTNLWLSISIAEENDEKPFYWHIYFDKKNWEAKSVNKLFLLIADDKIRNIIFYSFEKNIVYHPYDGGADLIFENSQLRDFYKEKYKDWLSNLPSGL